MKRTFFFYGIRVTLSSNSEPLLCRLEKDFSYFLEESRTPALVGGSVEIETFLGDIPSGLLPHHVKAIRQSINSITYEVDHIRYNDYYGEVISIFNYQRETAEIYATELERLHEVAFLLTLSRVEKKLDLAGFHKIHAFGVQRGDQTTVVQMPMKGGKTTLFLHLLKNPEFGIVSDDTPLISRAGRVYPFPIRAGIEELPPGLNVAAPALYSTHRKHYGKKTLIDLGAFPNPIASPSTKTVLLFGTRSTAQKPEIRPCSQFEMFRQLSRHMIIGIGLPMILEYFLETGTSDLWKRVKILSSRTWAAIRLLFRSRCYEFILGSNREENATFLEAWLKSPAAKPLLPFGASKSNSVHHQSVTTPGAPSAAELG